VRRRRGVARGLFAACLAILSFSSEATAATGQANGPRSLVTISGMSTASQVLDLTSRTTWNNLNVVVRMTTGSFAGFLITPIASKRPLAGAFVSRALGNRDHPLPLATARHLAAGTYRLTYLGDGPATIRVSVRGLGRDLSLQPRGAGVRVRYWADDLAKVAGGSVTSRPADISAGTYSLAFLQVSRARGPVYLQACLIPTPTVCRDDAVSVAAHIADCSAKCAQDMGRGQEYFPGELAPGRYYARWEAVGRGWSGVVGVLMTIDL